MTVRCAHPRTVSAASFICFSASAIVWRALVSRRDVEDFHFLALAERQEARMLREWRPRLFATQASQRASSKKSIPSLTSSRQ
jgi:hypothetical protein